MIPRPAVVRAGGPAPWASLSLSERRLSVEEATRAVTATPSADSVVPIPEGSKPAAVLVLLYEHHAEPFVVLTRRGWRLRHHAGEVSFPGGRQEPGDADLWATALREANEEVGLDPAVVAFVGRLDRFVTVGSRSLVCPYVAVAEQRPELVADPEEVDHVLHVPLAELTDDEAWREEIWSLPAEYGGDRTMTFFELPGDTIWGATAAVLRRLLTVALAGASA